LSTAEALPTLSANRGTEPKRLTALLRGELDWIVMKTLEKDRSRRYETANGLALDVQRYLAGEPVLAAPPSVRYRLRKFVRRNRVSLFLTLFVAASLVAIVFNRFLAAQEVRAERDRALAAAEGERLAKLDAQKQKTDADMARDNEARERVYAEEIAKFVKDDFLALTSVEGQRRFGGQELNRNATLRELLDRAAEKLKERKNLAPRTEAELSWIIGVSYREMGEAARAIPFLERSVELHRQASGTEAEATLRDSNFTCSVGGFRSC
jgi:hypothetical protein